MAALPLAHHHCDGEDAASSESANDDSDECARAEAIGVGALGPDDLGSLNAGDGQVVDGEAVLDKLGDESGLEGFCGGENARRERGGGGGRTVERGKADHGSDDYRAHGDGEGDGAGADASLLGEHSRDRVFLLSAVV